MSAIPEAFNDLLTKRKAFANLATINADGTPQVTPVWFDWDGSRLRINTAKGRVKDKNLRRTPLGRSVHHQSRQPLPVRAGQRPRRRRH